MDKLKDIHLSLPEALVQAMDRGAHMRGLRRAAALRQAVEELLARWERERLDAELESYVRHMASASDDWTRLTARGQARRLLEETEW